jgi:hypothetical protein
MNNVELLLGLAFLLMFSLIVLSLEQKLFLSGKNAGTTISKFGELENCAKKVENLNANEGALKHKMVDCYEKNRKLALWNLLTRVHAVISNGLGLNVETEKHYKN